MKRFLIMLIALLLALSVCAAGENSFEGIELELLSIKKYGNIVLDMPGSEALELGLEYGDIVTVSFDGNAFDVPVCSAYSDVDYGEAMLRVVVNEAEGDDEVALAVNTGDFATDYGIAVKVKTEEEPGYRWEFCEGVAQPVIFRIEMKEKGGYADEYAVHQLKRSLVRADYPELSDEQYANFRAVETAGMGEHALFRSSSPINPELNRSAEADAALGTCGVATVINLSDTEEAMAAMAGYEGSCYSLCSVLPLNLGMDFASDETRQGMAAAVRYMNEHDGPYLIHCQEGKDRTGFFAIVFECLMGATGEEITADYMETYYNFYGVVSGTEQYDAILRSNLLMIAHEVFGLEDIYAGDADLAGHARGYLYECGLTDGEIDTLMAKLGADY